MKQSPFLLKLLLGLVFILGASKASAQVGALADLNPATLAAYCDGSQVKLTAASPGAASYIWKRYAGTNTAGAATTLAGTTANLVDVPPAPGYYTYTSTSVNAEGCESAAASDPAIVYVLPGITASIVSNTPATTQYCTNAVPASLTLTATGGESTTVAENFTYVYQWYKNGVAITGATGQTYTLNSTDDSAVGTGIAYTVQINYPAALKTCSAATSNAINFNVIALPTKPTITITP